MPRRLLFLINPISGTGSRTSIKDLITKKTTAAGLEFRVFPSVESGDYSFLHPIIREEGFTDVIIAGGDGTINQAINSLRGLKINFGILPCGSGNGLAFSASLPKNPSRAMDIILKGKSRLTDAFYINHSFACMLCGLGLDAQVAHDFANDPRRGLRTYVRKTIAGFIRAKTYPFTIRAGGRKIKTDAYFISVANSNQFGNHFTIAPKASLHDGLLDIVVMSSRSKAAMLMQSLLQVAGYHPLSRLEVVKEKGSVLYFQAGEIEITNEGAAPMHIDGDPVETMKQLHIRVIKDCFRLIYP